MAMIARFRTLAWVLLGVFVTTAASADERGADSLRVFIWDVVTGHRYTGLGPP